MDKFIMNLKEELLLWMDLIDDIDECISILTSF